MSLAKYWTFHSGINVSKQLLLDVNIEDIDNQSLRDFDYIIYW